MAGNSIVILRHGKKEKTDAVGGSEEDKLTDLSPEGQKQCYESGKYRINPPYDHIVVITSDFKRTETTAKKFLEGMGYDIEDHKHITLVKRPDIGLGGFDWFGEGMPDWKNESEDACIEKMLKDHYKPVSGRPEIPHMAGFASSMFEILNTYVSLQTIDIRKKRETLLLVATHAPIIDAIANSLYGSLIVNPDGTYKVRDFPGAFETGEQIMGSLDISTKNPRASFFIKERHVLYTPSELKGMEVRHKFNSGRV